jgi:hypothetical protein
MALETFVVKIADADWSAIGDKIEKDAAIRDGCAFCYDFADPNSFPLQANAVGPQPIYDLVDGGEDAVTGSGTLAFTAGKGLGFSVAGSEWIEFSDASKFIGNDTGFMVVFWIKGGTQTQALRSNVIGYYDHTNDDGPFGVTYQNPTLSFRVNGQLVRSETWTPDGLVHQYAVAWFNDPDFGWRVRVYKDAAMVADLAATNSTLAPPTVAPTRGAGFGDTGGNGDNSFAIFTAYRALGYDLDGWTAGDILDLLELDLAENAARFS